MRLEIIEISVKKICMETKKKKTEKRKIERKETKNIKNVKITNRDNIVNNSKNK